MMQHSHPPGTPPSQVEQWPECLNSVNGTGRTADNGRRPRSGGVARGLLQAPRSSPACGGAAMDLEIFGFGGVLALVVAAAIAVVIYNLLSGREL